MEEMSREYYLAHSGHKATAELQPIYAKYAGILGPDALALALDAFQRAPEGSEEQRSTRLLLDWQAEAQSARQLAPLDEREIAWEGIGGRSRDRRARAFRSRPCRSRWPTAPIEPSGTRSRRRARSWSSGELAPIRRERFQRERDITEELGLAPNYNATFELLSGISLAALQGGVRAVPPRHARCGTTCCRSSRSACSAWTSGDVTRADALALFRAREFDASFPSKQMEESIRRQVREMGIDPLAAGRITLDTGEREGKRARAFCAPVRVPDEVYLVLRPHGGQTDWTTFLHELGHALHFAYMRPDLAFEYRWLGDNSITEGYAMLFDHLMKDAGWLKRYTELRARSSAPFMRSTGFEELHFLRRYCAKLIYEVELYGGTTCVGVAARPLRREAERGDDVPLQPRPTRSSTSIRGSTRRAICARGSCRR